MYKKIMQERGYIVLDSDVYNIGKRLKEYDPCLFLVWDNSKQEYQVWSSEKGLQFVVWAKELDARILEKVKKADGRTSYGLKAKLDEINSERELKERKERIDAAESAKEFKSALEIVDKGRKSYVM